MAAADPNKKFVCANVEFATVDLANAAFKKLPHPPGRNAAKDARGRPQKEVALPKEVFHLPAPPAAPTGRTPQKQDKR
eukprot:130573-Prorocentrum_minimum.AAC.1